MRGKWRWAAIAGAALLGAGAAWGVADAVSFARIGTAFAAKQTCSCLYVAGREMASCKGDYPADTAKLFTWTVRDGTVTVSVAGGLISGEAQFEDGYGCRPSR